MSASDIRRWRPAGMADMSHKTVVITGANSGLGFETAKELARHGARLIFLCRNTTKAASATRQIQQLVPAAHIENIPLDLSSLQSVRQAADAVLKAAPHIDVLINNAGIMMIPKRELTQDGLEMQMGVNHFGHFLLTALLFPAIERAHGRIVVLGSLAHKAATRGLRLDNLNSEHHYQSFLTYAQSKLANVQFGLALARKVTERQKPVQVYIVHPGYAKTNLQSTGPSGFMRFLMRFSDLVAQSANKGAWPSMMAASTNLFEHGRFYGPTWLNLVGPDGECSVTPHAADARQQALLWQRSEEAVGMRFDL